MSDVIFERLLNDFKVNHERIIENTPNMIAALLGADINNDGIINSYEHLQAIDAGLYIKEGRENLSKLDCTNNSDLARLYAAEAAASLQRKIDVLAENSPGHHAKDLTEITINSLASHLKTVGINLKPDQVQSLKDLRESQIIAEDREALTAYKSHSDPDKRLPKKVLPMDTDALCNRAAARSL